MAIWRMVMVLVASWIASAINVDLPTITLQYGEKYSYDFLAYYNKPNMDMKVIKDKDCDQGVVQINVENIIEKVFIYTVNDEMNKISFPESSMILKLLLSEHDKAYYLAYFDSNLVFYLHDISNYSQINKKASVVIPLGSISVKGYWPFNMDYKECSDLDYDLK